MGHPVVPDICPYFLLFQFIAIILWILIFVPMINDEY